MVIGITQSYASADKTERFFHFRFSFLLFLLLFTWDLLLCFIYDSFALTFTDSWVHFRFLGIFISPSLSRHCFPTLVFLIAYSMNSVHFGSIQYFGFGTVRRDVSGQHQAKQKQRAHTFRHPFLLLLLLFVFVWVVFLIDFFPRSNYIYYTYIYFLWTVTVTHPHASVPTPSEKY